MPSKKQDVQYRYYKTPPDSPVLALLGDGWIRPYGTDENAGLHFHNLLEIGYCYAGTGNMIYGNDIIPYNPSDISVIPPNYLHNTITAPNTVSQWEYLFVDTESFLTCVYTKEVQMSKILLSRVHNSFLHVRHETYKELGDLILAIANLYRDKCEMYLESVRGLLIALLIQIARQHPTPLGKNELSQQGALVIHRALEFVGDRYYEKISVSNMAEACHISETHLRRLFDQYMHVSPLAYVNLVRVEAAHKLLSTTNESIRNIAIQCGFPTLSTFNRNFLEAMGVTPMQWRKNTAHHHRQANKQTAVRYDGWR